MNLLLVALLLATQTPGAQDTVAQVLLRLEDDWTVGLTHRDAALFRRLLADGFIYTEDDRTVGRDDVRSEEHTSELQSQFHLVCRLLLEKKKKKKTADLINIQIARKE